MQRVPFGLGRRHCNFRRRLRGVRSGEEGIATPPSAADVNAGRRGMDAEVMRVTVSLCRPTPLQLALFVE